MPSAMSRALLSLSKDERVLEVGVRRLHDYFHKYIVLCQKNILGQ